MEDNPGVGEQAGLTPEEERGSLEEEAPHHQPLTDEQLMIQSVSVALTPLTRRDTWFGEEQTIAFLEVSVQIPKEVIKAELMNLLDSSSLPIDCKVKDTGNVTLFEISNWLPSSGVYQLHVCVCGEEVRGSPFSVTVKTPVNKLGTVIETIDGVNNPWGVGVKKSGEVIVAEESSDCISVFSCNGEKTHPTDAQDEDVHLKQICSPRGLAVDSEDNILVVESGRNQLLKISPEGECRIAPVGNTFKDPVDVCVNNGDGKVYVVDKTRHCVHILNPDLTYSGKFGTYGSGNGQLLSPTGIAHSKGYLYVADTNNSRVQVFTYEGEYVWQFGKKGVDSELFRPISICVDDDDLVYVGERVSTVSVFTTEGEYRTSFNSLQPYGIAVAPCGVIYVCDNHSGKILMY